jgi:hypothetical protein
MVTHKQMVEANITAHERNLLVNLLKGISYDKSIKEIQYAGKLQASA